MKTDHLSAGLKGAAQNYSETFAHHLPNIRSQALAKLPKRRIRSITFAVVLIVAIAAVVSASASQMSVDRHGSNVLPVAGDSPSVTYIELGGAQGPGSLVGDEDGVWIDADNGMAGMEWRFQLTFIDAATGVKTETSPVSEGGQLNFGGDHLWIASTGSFKDRGPYEPDPGLVQRIDPKRAKPDFTIEVDGAPIDVAATHAVAWVANVAEFGDRRVWQLDAGSGRVLRRVDLGESTWEVLIYEGRAFFKGDSGTIYVLDATSGRLERSIDVADCPNGIVGAAGSLWVADCTGDVLRFDPSTGELVARIHLGGRPTGLAYLQGSIWAVDNVSGRVFRIAVSNDLIVGEAATVMDHAIFITAGGGYLWVSGMSEPSVARIDP